MDDIPRRTALGAVDVRDWGARGDGRTLETPALQAALDACAADGGGTVLVPAGRYVTGALVLHSDLTLHLDAGAVLHGSEDPADYPVVSGRWEGIVQPVYAPLLGGEDLHHVAITGRGTIDGCGAAWWQAFRAGALRYPRPRLIAFTRCANVLIEGVSTVASPGWTIHPCCCENVTVSRVTILNAPDSPNTDGINPDSCRHVHITDCHVSVGDDCIAIKSGAQLSAETGCLPCEDITVANCTLVRGHGAIVIGSETSGDIRNVVVSNCVFRDTDRGIRIKTRRGRGGVVEDIRVSNVVMTGVRCPITMNLHYACGAWGDPVVADTGARPEDAGTPRVRRVHFAHISAREAHVAAGFLYGLAERPLEEITLDDVSIAFAATAEAGYPDMAHHLEPLQRAGFCAAHVRGLRLHDVSVTGQVGPALDLCDSGDVEISAGVFRTGGAGIPAIRLRNIAGAFLHGCQAVPGTDVFVQVEGEGTADICLHGNQLRQARRPCVVGAGASPQAVRLSGQTAEELPS